ncbi:hypothetical protein BCR33DRAFT_711861 [Rhizoclosmatium globosum]|uniref:Uncharacterized protein n=1 Tax=Rhizoclosmatium globosum TaxID=329046 RepID=A0A1Y2D0D5_9FUNG|nr:hypothetical protein BCR33DRAFT_711861 [Rhizoclosmatium globosum]|eukprot:ORY52586.1 hypothetical protein BCR33DRAFT_711861 [Rhizoclosmatium globosum]
MKPLLQINWQQTIRGSNGLNQRGTRWSNHCPRFNWSLSQELYGLLPRLRHWLLSRISCSVFTFHLGCRGALRLLTYCCLTIANNHITPPQSFNTNLKLRTILRGAKNQQDSGKPLALFSLNISHVSGEDVTFNALAEQTLSEISPLSLRLSPARIVVESLGNLPLPLPQKPRYLPWPRRIPASWSDEDSDFNIHSTPLLDLEFPGLQVPAHASKAPISFVDSKLQHFYSDLLDPLVSDSVKYLVDVSNYDRNATNAQFNVSKPVPPSPITLRHRFAPTYWFPSFSFWKWDIPMWQYHRLDLSTLPQPNKTTPDTDDLFKKLNLTVTSQTIDTIPILLPNHTLPTLIYVINLTLSFTNPTDTLIRLNDIHTSLHARVSHKGKDMLNVKVRVPSIEAGRNEDALKVDLWSVAENGGTQALMDWVGLYAEGTDTTVNVHGLWFEDDDENNISSSVLEVGKKKKRVVSKMGWIDVMVQKWALDVFVPGGEPESEWRRWGWVAGVLKKMGV